MAHRAAATLFSYLLVFLEAPLSPCDTILQVGRSPIALMRKDPVTVKLLAYDQLNAFKHDVAPIHWRRLYEDAVLWEVLEILRRATLCEWDCEKSYKKEQKLLKPQDKDREIGILKGLVDSAQRRKVKAESTDDSYLNDVASLHLSGAMERKIDDNDGSNTASSTVNDNSFVNASTSVHSASTIISPGPKERIKIHKKRYKVQTELWSTLVIQKLDNLLLLTGSPGRRLLVDFILMHLTMLDIKQEQSVQSDSCGIPRERSRLRDGQTSGEYRDCTTMSRFFKHIPTAFARDPAAPDPLVKHPILRIQKPSILAFQNHTHIAATPIVLTETLNHWPALERWKRPSYWLDQTHDGRRLVPVEIGKSYTESGWSQAIVSFGRFMQACLVDSDRFDWWAQLKEAAAEPGIDIRDYSYEEEERSSHNEDTDKLVGLDTAYLAQHDLFHQIPALRSDIAIPDYCYIDAPGPDEKSSEKPTRIDTPMRHSPVMSIGPEPIAVDDPNEKDDGQFHFSEEQRATLEAQCFSFMCLVSGKSLREEASRYEKYKTQDFMFPVTAPHADRSVGSSEVRQDQAAEKNSHVDNDPTEPMLVDDNYPPPRELEVLPANVTCGPADESHPQVQFTMHFQPKDLPPNFTSKVGLTKANRRVHSIAVTPPGNKTPPMLTSSPSQPVSPVPDADSPASRNDFDEVSSLSNSITTNQEPQLNIWLGPGGTVSPAHTDPHHNILAQVVGRKYVRLFAPNQSSRLYPGENSVSAMSLDNTSQVDVGLGVEWEGDDEEDGDEDVDITMTDACHDEPFHLGKHSRVDDSFEEEESEDERKPRHHGSDLRAAKAEKRAGIAERKALRSEMEDQHPLIKDAEYVECILEEGECLYIPRGWWHYVRSLEGSISVSFWWD